jgi:hypothetical protein
VHRDAFELLGKTSVLPATTSASQETILMLNLSGFEKNASVASVVEVSTIIMEDDLQI